MTTTKSPRRVLQYSYLVGLLTLRLHSNKFSRKDFNQPQLFACLVLKEFLRLDYRKASVLLRDTPDLAAVIELKKVPHFTTLQKAADRLLTWRPARRLLDLLTAFRNGGAGRSKVVALGGEGVLV
jgi:hypothetical protein